VIRKKELYIKSCPAALGLFAGPVGFGPENLTEGFDEGARRLRTGKRGDAVEEKERYAI
jgi:hypothetical protein